MQATEPTSRAEDDRERPSNRVADDPESTPARPPPDESLLIAVSGLDGSGSRANLRGFSEICALYAVGCSEVPPHRDGNPTIAPLEAGA